MLDERLSEFAHRAESTVDLPDLSAIADRGDQLRRTRRRRTAVAAVAVVAVVGGGYLAASDLGSSDVGPVRPPDVNPWPGNSDAQDVAAGTYEMELHREGSPATARFTVAHGWKGWFGPNRFVEQPHDRYVGVLIGDVEEVATRVCTDPVSRMRPVGDTATELVEALSDIPRHSVVDGPDQVAFDSLPATHLTLLADTDATCRVTGALELWNAPGAGGLIPALGPDATIDLWVVDLGGEAILVSATSARGTPDWAMREMDAIVDSIEFERTS